MCTYTDTCAFLHNITEPQKATPMHTHIHSLPGTGLSSKAEVRLAHSVTTELPGHMHFEGSTHHPISQCPLDQARVGGGTGSHCLLQWGLLSEGDVRAPRPAGLPFLGCWWSEGGGTHQRVSVKS